MARIHLGRGRAGVTVDDGMRDIIDHIIRTRYQDVADMLEAEAQAIHAHARRGWPVATGASRDALRWRLEFRPPSRLAARVYIDPTAPGRVRRTTVDASGARGRGVRVETSRIAARPVTYIRFVRALSLGGRNPWEVLVRLPALQRHRKLAKEMAVRLRSTRAARPKPPNIG